MEKSKEQLLSDYKKSNKVRRAKIVAKAGFTTESAYLTYLTTAERTPGSTRLSKPVAKTVRISGKAKLSQLLKKFQPEKEQTLDVVVAFDTTGSMSSYVESVKKHVEKLVTEWFENIPNLRMKIVAFGDYCDMRNSKDFGNAYQESVLTDDANLLIKFIKNVKNTSGGDGDEFYELVIKKITEETPWRDGKRSVLLIADCDPHRPGYTYPGIVNNSQIDWREEAKKAAAKGITFDTLTISDYQSTLAWYKELSDITGGISLPFTSKSQKQTGEMIGATMYARGASDAVYDTAMKSASTPEMTAVFKTLSTLR